MKTLGLSAEKANKWFENSEETFSVSVEKLAHWIKEYLDRQAQGHRLLFLVDEVGQFIGKDTKLMLTLQTITENLGTICGGRAWVIVTSQADMDAVLGELSASKANDFSKIAGRFKTRLSLSSSNTDEVIQKRLLRKDDAASAALTKLYTEKGDILKNQITFDRTGPTLKNYDGVDSFVNNYPFAPYHFQLVQKVFEEIRKVGATGAHLAYGERSMLDAFQLAAQEIADLEVGELVPMHLFYNAVEGFLDTAVKRTIDQAKDNESLTDFDIKMLRTLFMIRYVDLVKGTLDNLVTLSIDKVDADKLTLRKDIEASLQRLEKESLISRNGDEFQFLTNEERDIAQKIKATDVSSAEENKKLGELLYKDLLKDKNKFRYKLNKTDYTIGRFLDEHTLDGRYETDLKVEVITPQDLDYASYGEAKCINKSAEALGSVLFKLPDDKRFFVELRTWLKTHEFIRLNNDKSQAELTRILDERGRENRERNKWLSHTLETLFTQTEVYCLGTKLTLGNSSIVTQFDEACEYLLINTFRKLDYLKVPQDDPYKKLREILSNNADQAQVPLSELGETGNAQAVKEVEQHISLATAGNERILVTDLLDKFNKRPYGWHEAEILIIIAQLAVSGHISFQRQGGTLTLKNAYEPLANSRLRREVSIIKKRRTEEAVLKQARSLSQELFTRMGAATEKELYEFYTQHFNGWLANLKSYKSKAEVGHFPGKNSIDASLQTLQRLLTKDDSYDFFQEVVNNKDDYLDLEEDYRDLHEFFTSQLTIWKQLQLALNRFAVNQTYLQEQAEASQAFKELQRINEADAPYGELHKVTQYIQTIDSINQQLLDDIRQQASQAINEKIETLQSEIKVTNINNADLSNNILFPLQNLKQSIAKDLNLSNIYRLQNENANRLFELGLEKLETFVEQEIQKREKEAKAAEKASKATNATGTSTTTAVRDDKDKPALVQPKPAVSLSSKDILRNSVQKMYIENELDIATFISRLEQELEKQIKAGKRVRLE